MFYDREFVEPIARFRVMYQETLPAEHQAAYRLRGLDPADMWTLEWSFHDQVDAEEMLAECIERAAKWGTRTYRMVDARPTFFQLGYAAGVCPRTVEEIEREFPRPNEREWWTDGFRCNGGIIL